MIDFKKIFEDLRQQAATASTDLELEKRVEQGKDLAEDAIEKIKTDRNAQIAAGGAGALLLAAMLGTRGGRRFTGGVAKTGAVAALGALAYHAWMNRDGQAKDGMQTPAEVAGFVTDQTMDSAFAEALVRTMVAAAWADDHLDTAERSAIESALAKAGSDDDARALFMNRIPEAENLDIIARAANSPNHAAQIYAAACVITGDPNPQEASFLARLAGRLGIEGGHAAAIRAEVRA